jgi:hypothetical protein
LFKNKRGNINAAVAGTVSMVVGLVVIAVVLVLGYNMTDNMKSSQTANSLAYNATNTIQTQGLGTVTNNISNITQIMIFGVIIGLLIAAVGVFMFLKQR